MLRGAERWANKMREVGHEGLSNGQLIGMFMSWCQSSITDHTVEIRRKDDDTDSRSGFSGFYSLYPLSWWDIH